VRQAYNNDIAIIALPIKISPDGVNARAALSVAADIVEPHRAGKMLGKLAHFRRLFYGGEGSSAGRAFSPRCVFLEDSCERTALGAIRICPFPKLFSAQFLRMEFGRAMTGLQARLSQEAARIGLLSITSM